MPIANKTKELTTGAITPLLGAVNDFVHSITYDNGREFNGHLAVS
jgi:IS30 family transposase